MSVRLRRDGEVVTGPGHFPCVKDQALEYWRDDNDSWLHQAGRDRWDMSRWRWDEFTRPDDSVLEVHLMGWHPGWDEAVGTGYVIEVDP